MSGALGKDAADAADGTSAASSPMNVHAISNAMSTASLRASSPTSITPATTAATINLSNPSSSLQSVDNIHKLAAMYQSSRRSRNSSPEKTQLRVSIQDLPPPPPIYSATDEEHADNSSSAQPVVVSINTMRDSWNMSMSSGVNTSFLTSSNSTVLAANPPIVGASSRQQGNFCTKKKKQDNIDWSELNKYSIERRESSAGSGAPVPEGDDFSSTAPLDDSEYSHVRSRAEFEIDFNFDEDTGKLSMPGADGCNPAELPAPPNKRNRRGTLTIETNPLVQPNDTPASPSSCSSVSSSEIYDSKNAYTSFRVSSHFNDDINLNRSSTSEKLSPFPSSRRKSLELEDLENDQLKLCQPAQVTTGIEDSQLIRRKIQRLLLIRHCTTCSIRSIPLPTTGYFCPVTSHCAEGKALCAHIKTCKLDDCTYKKCLTTRQVLGHYMNCRDAECKICGQVRSRDKRRRNQMNDDIEWRHANMLL